MGRALATGLWGLWSLLLLATPFSLVGFGEMPPYLTSSYAYVAVGLVVGIACMRCLELWLPFGPSRAGGVMVLALGLVLTVFLVLPDWAYFCSGSLCGKGLSPEELGGIPVLGPLFSAAGMLVGEHDALYLALLAASGAACSFVACWLDGLSDGREHGVQEGADGRAQRKIRVFCALMLFLFFLGVFMPGFWAPYATAVGVAVSPERWRVEEVPFTCYLPTLGMYLVTVLLMASGSAVLRRGGRSGLESPEYLGILVASFAAGQIAWNLVSRCVQVRRLFDIACAPMGIAVIALEAAFAAALVTLWLLGKHARVLAGPEKANADDTAAQAEGEVQVEAPALQRLEDLFHEWGLAPSEQAASRLMLEGKTSAESAEALGLKSSTVRNYLQRSYRKAGVSNAGEFRRRLEERGAIASDGAPPEDAESGTDAAHLPDTAPAFRDSRPVLAPTMLLVGFLGSLCLLCLPVIPRSTLVSWGPVHSLVLGLGMGLSLAGGAGLLAERFGWEARRRKRGNAPAMALCLLFALSGLVLVVLLWASFRHVPSGNAALLLGTCLAAGLYAVGASAVSPAVFRGLFRGKPPANVPAVLAFVAAELALACLGERAWLALEVVDLIAFAVAAPRLPGLWDCAPGPKCRGGGLVFAVGFSFALVLEELMRGPGAAFFEGLVACFLLVAVFICTVFVVKGRRQPDQEKLPVIAVVATLVAVLAMSAMGHVLSGLGFLALCLFALTANSHSTPSKLTPRSFAQATLGFGVGLLVGRCSRTGGTATCSGAGWRSRGRAAGSSASWRCRLSSPFLLGWVSWPSRSSSPFGTSPRQRRPMPIARNAGCSISRARGSPSMRPKRS